MVFLRFFFRCRGNDCQFIEQLIKARTEVAWKNLLSESKAYENSVGVAVTNYQQRHDISNDRREQSGQRGLEIT